MQPTLSLGPDEAAGSSRIQHELAGIWIECLHWRAFIERWDRSMTLFTDLYPSCS